MKRPPHTFAATLKAKLKDRYDSEIPQADMLTRLFNMRCEEKDAINKGTMQGWLDGKSEIPQADMLARLFNMRCEEKDAINKGTMQGWLDGKIEPTGLQLKTLRAWLDL